MADEEDRTNPDTTTSSSVIDEFNREIENQRREVENLVNGADETSQSPTPSRDEGPTPQRDDSPNPPRDEGPTPPAGNQPQHPGELGVSSAYADMNMGKAKEPKKSRPAPTPPKRPEKDKDKDYKDIMELFWQEVILASYSGIINKATDLTMDFVDYVLYHKSDGKDQKTQLDHYTIAKSIKDKECEKTDKKVDAATARLAEVLNNLEKVKNGEEPTWELNKKKPQCFDEASRIYNKAENERTPDEKLFIEGIFNSVNSIKELNEAEKKLIGIAAGCAAEKVRNDDMNGDVISSTFTQSMKKIEEELSKKTPDKNIITAYVGLASKEVESGCEVHKSISEKLTAIQEATNGGDFKAAKKGIKDIHQIEEENAYNPHFRQVKMAKATQENISAIRAEDDRLIASGNQHTVSKEFTEKLREMNRAAISNVLSEDEKKAKLTELTTSMKDMLTADTPEQKAMKEQLTQMGTKLQNGDTNISEHLDKLNKTHTENLPIYKFTQQLVTNAETLKETNNKRKGFKGMYRPGTKKKTASYEAAKLEDSFKKDEAKATVPPSDRTFEEILYNKNRSGR